MALLLLRTVKLSQQWIRCRTVTVGQGLRDGTQRYATWTENFRTHFARSCKNAIRSTSSLGSTSSSAAHPSRTYSSHKSYSSQALSRLREACESPFPGRCPRDPFSTVRWCQFSHSSPESPDEFGDESESCERKGSVISESDLTLPMWNLPDSIETLPGLENDYHLKLEAFLRDMGLAYEPRALWLRVMIHETLYQHLTQLRDSMAVLSEAEEKEAGLREEEDRKVPLLNLGAAHSAIRSQLELIGDNFIGLMASIYLISKHPYASKGDITVMKGEMVNNRNMAKVAKELGLLDVFRTLPPIKDFDPEVNGFESTVAANCLEIFSGATFMSEGMSATADVINRQVLPLLIAGLGSSEKMKRAVNLVQEKSYRSLRSHPTYK